jgi:hypothetical protein
MQKKYIYIAISVLLLVVTLVTINYLRKPKYQEIYNSDVKIIKSIDSSKYYMKQYTDSVKSLNDSVEYYKMAIEENNLKLKKLQAKKNEASKNNNVVDLSVNDYKRFLTERYK